MQVFIPEVIPLENKGEEAILRGLEDVLFPSQPVHFHILALNCSKPKTMGNITMYPRGWFYPRWTFREVFVSLNPLDVLNLIGFLFLVMRNRLPCLARRAHLAVWLNEKLMMPSSVAARIWKERAAALKRLSQVDFVLAGHDNAMWLREAHLLQSLSKRGMAYGVFGCGMNSRFPNATVARVYHTAFQKAKFLYFRDQETWKGILESGGLSEAQLAPDPAFGMRAAEEPVIEGFLKKEGLSAFFSKPVVAITVVDNDVVVQSFKAHKWTSQKAEAHYRLIGPFVDHMVETWGVNVLFLPHCIGPTPRLDDRRVARNVLRYSMAGPGSVRILETPCDARLLKGLIKRSSLLIGERTHSLIGAISVGTPFICLGSTSDKRTREIIGNMCHASHLVYDLKTPSLESLTAFADAVWRRRDEVEQQVKMIGKGILDDLEKSARAARSRMPSQPIIHHAPIT
jgi:polysaccharide pyruvyl transferase WcaK-like protein